MGEAAASSKVYGTVRFIDPDLSVPAQERAIFAAPAPKIAKDQSVELHNFRTSTDIAKDFEGLNVQAFTFIEHEFSLSGDELLEGTNVEEIYAKEVIDLMLKFTGASRAVIHNIAFRRRPAERQQDLYNVQRRGGPVDQECSKLPKDRVLGEH